MSDVSEAEVAAATEALTRWVWAEFREPMARAALQAAAKVRAQIGDEGRPTIVVLCGSTRFPEAWAKARYDLTLAGEIVLTIGCDTKSDEGLGITAEQKVALDELHKRKIDLADRVLVLNVGGYIGESTRSEITYAEAHHKPIDYLEAQRATMRDPIKLEEWEIGTTKSGRLRPMSGDPPTVILDDDMRHVIWTHDCTGHDARMSVKLPVGTAGWDFKVDSLGRLSGRPSIRCDCGVHGFWTNGVWHDC